MQTKTKTLIYQKGPNNLLYVLDDRSILWKYDGTWKNLGQISNVFQKLESDITGAVRDDSNINWFFKGNINTFNDEDIFKINNFSSKEIAFGLIKT